MTPVELFGRVEFPRDRRAAVPAHARAARLLLVLARAAGRGRPREQRPAAARRARPLDAVVDERRAAAPRSSASCPPGCAPRGGSARRPGACARPRSPTSIAHPRSASTRRAAARLPRCSCASSTPTATARPTSCRSRAIAATTPQQQLRRPRSRSCTAATATACCTTPCTTPRFARALLDLVPRPAAPAGQPGALVAIARRRACARCAARTSSPSLAARRAEQHVGHLRRQAGPEDVPPGRGGPEPRRRGRPLPHRAARFANSPPCAARSSTGRRTASASTLAVLQEFVPNEGDAWSYTLDALGRFFEDALAPRAASRRCPSARSLELLDAGAAGARPRDDRRLPRAARALGQRTAELHVALALDRRPGVRARAVHALARRALYQSMRSSRAGLRARCAGAAASSRAAPGCSRARPRCSSGSAGCSTRRSSTSASASTATTTSGQVLWTGKDFVIIDFEGEPARPLSERRIKRSPCATSPGCCARSTTPRTPGSSPSSAGLPAARGRRSAARRTRWQPTTSRRRRSPSAGRCSGTAWSARRSCGPTSRPRAAPGSCPARRDIVGAARRPHAREGHVRARVRGEQPAGLDVDPRSRASCSCSRTRR